METTDKNDTLKSDNSRGINAEVYARLRKMILEGTLPPSSVVTQVELAKLLGVSRTPLREAFRMLQSEGLLEVEPNQRARVASVNPQNLDAFYAQRIFMEVLGITITVPHLGREEIDTLKGILKELDEAASHNDSDAWEAPHRHFHALLFSQCSKQLKTTLASLNEKSEFYRRMYINNTPLIRTLTIAQLEHHSIAKAVFDKQTEIAAQTMARHLARTALSLLSGVAPEYDPIAVRSALHVVGATSDTVEVAIPKKTSFPLRKISG